MTATRTAPATGTRTSPTRTRPHPAPARGRATLGNATLGNAAPVFAPRPEPRRLDAPARSRHLRLVDPAEARQRRRTRALTGFLVALVCAGLFAIVAMRVVLAQGQVEVDRLEKAVDASTATQQQLRLQVAELEAPAQIVAAARTRLGMVTPGAVNYLIPPPPQAR